VASHKKNISEMSGLGRTMPFTFAAFGIASLSKIGAPPVAGFVTKWKLLVGTMEMESYYIGILLVLLASTLLNVGYFAPVTYKAFFGKRPAGEKYEGIKEAPLSMVIPIMVAAIISVLIGIFPGLPCRNTTRRVHLHLFHRLRAMARRKGSMKRPPWSMERRQRSSMEHRPCPMVSRLRTPVRISV
jgi:formate hydrogenlyase subunit 3/multisubunit Na+/H+ antiporter MnhD subunit